MLPFVNRSANPPLEIYWASGSQPSWRVLLTLEAKEIPYDSKLISFQKGDHKTPQFLAMNPRHKVPTLRHCDFSLYESRAIMNYLDRAYPEHPLFGQDARQAGFINRHIDEFSHYFEPHLMGYVRPLFFNRQDELREQVESSIEGIEREAIQLAPELACAAAGPGWLVGDRLSAADIYLFPVFKALFRALEKPVAAQFGLTEQKLAQWIPDLEPWMRKIEALPYYDKTYPPHWRAS